MTARSDLQVSVGAVLSLLVLLLAVVSITVIVVVQHRRGRIFRDPRGGWRTRFGPPEQ